jgi:hypothetical protein
MAMQWILIMGDLAAMAVVTIIGFATHDEAQASALPRMAALYLPLAASWFLLAPWFGLFRGEVAADIRQVWRPGLAMIFAVPAAVVVRGMILSGVVLPLFGVIFAGTCALGMVLWRAVAVLFVRRLNTTNHR